MYWIRNDLESLCKNEKDNKRLINDIIYMIRNYHIVDRKQL